MVSDDRRLYEPCSFGWKRDFQVICHAHCVLARLQLHNCIAYFGVSSKPRETWAFDKYLAVRWDLIAFEDVSVDGARRMVDAVVGVHSLRHAADVI